MSDIDIKRISYLAKLKLPSEKEEFYANSLKISLNGLIT